MTQRLYYDDAYTTRFTAEVAEHLTINNRSALILDKTYFYPTSGGQPFDTGKINDIPVIDVFSREEDAAVVHVLERVAQPTTVTAAVDWSRRFDHMQHHTGQHILTQAFVRVANTKTVGFHLSPDTVTIDVDTNNIPEQQIDAAEDLANQIVFENRPVKAYLRDLDQQEGVRVRRLPRHLLTEGLRVIEIEDFDATACGGTHVSRTGEIGVIKVLKEEKRGDKTRIEFRCGSRALLDYREKARVAYRLTSALNTRFSEVPDAISRMRDDFKNAQTELKAASNQLMDYEVNHLLSTANLQGDKTIIVAVFEGRDPGQLRLLASRLASQPRTIALLGLMGGKSHLCFARSDDLHLNISQSLKEALTKLGGNGGGQPNLAQGGGKSADLVTIQNILHETAQNINVLE